MNSTSRAKITWTFLVLGTALSLFLAPIRGFRLAVAEPLFNDEETEQSFYDEENADYDTMEQQGEAQTELPSAPCELTRNAKTDALAVVEGAVIKPIDYRQALDEARQGCEESYFRAVQAQNGEEASNRFTCFDHNKYAKIKKGHASLKMTTCRFAASALIRPCVITSATKYEPQAGVTKVTTYIKFDAQLNPLNEGSKTSNAAVDPAAGTPVVGWTAIAGGSYEIYNYQCWEDDDKDRWVPAPAANSY